MCADQPSEPIADEREETSLQYFVGHHRRPRNPHRNWYIPAEAPNRLTPLMTAVGITGESVYLSPAPLYHTRAAYWSMVVQSMGGRRWSWRSSTAAGVECIEPIGA